MKITTLRSFSCALLGLITYIVGILCISTSVIHASLLSSHDKEILRKINLYLGDNDFTIVHNLKKQLNNKGAQNYVQWKYLTHNHSVPSYDELLNFVRHNPHMPRKDILREKIENNLAGLSFSQQKKVFASAKVRTLQGKIAKINYLFNANQVALAKPLLHSVWHNEALTVGQQNKILMQYKKYLSAENHSMRISYLCDNERYTQARLLLPYGHRSDKTKLNIRYQLIKLRKNSYNNLKKLPKSIRQDGGVLKSLVYYFRKTDQDLNAIQIIKNLTKKQSSNNPDAWYQSRNILSRVAFKRGLKGAAYQIISNHHLKSGGDYVTAEFYAGWLALRHFKRSTTALRHFKNGLNKSSMPISVSRFEYWIGRSCRAMNDKPCEKLAYTNAAQYFYTFYGQLAAYHLQEKTINIPAYPNPDERIKQAFFADKVVQAAYAAQAMNNQSDVRLLISSVAQRKNKHHATLPLLEKLTQELGDLKTRVKVAKAASKNNDFLMIGYPVIDLKHIRQIPEVPLVYALTRQESEFDIHAKSHVGARGLMQIMPATGRQLARQLGKSFRVKYLQKPTYNMTLGGFYIKQLINKFNGSYIHALSGYNAGPSRIGQWDESYGRFNNNLYQIIDRIETIPFSETRNYVQRILENLQIYRSKLKGRNYIVIDELINDLHRGI